MLAVAVAALAPASGAAQQQPAPKVSDEQRCTGQAGVTPPAQVAACTALIDSGRFTRQNLAILHSNRGIAHGKAGDYERAMADFDAALRVNPNHLRAFVNRGNANFARRDYDRAIDDFAQAIRLEPKNATIVMSRATAYEAKGDFANAIADYDQALKLDPNLTAAITNRGLACRRAGNLNRAIADFDQVIKLNPKDATAYNNRAIALADRREFERAAADYEAALKLDPNFALATSTAACSGMPARTTIARSPISTVPRLAPDKPPRSTPAASRSLPRASSTAPWPIRPRHRARTEQRRLYDNRGNAWRNRGRFDRAVELRQGDRALARLRRFLPPLAGALPRRPVFPGAGRRHQGRGAQRERPGI